MHVPAADAPYAFWSSATTAAEDFVVMTRGSHAEGERKTPPVVLHCSSGTLEAHGHTIELPTSRQKKQPRE